MRPQHAKRSQEPFQVNGRSAIIPLPLSYYTNVSGVSVVHSYLQLLKFDKQTIMETSGLEFMSNFLYLYSNRLFRRLNTLLSTHVKHVPTPTILWFCDTQVNSFGGWGGKSLQLATSTHWESLPDLLTAHALQFVTVKSKVSLRAGTQKKSPQNKLFERSDPPNRDGRLERGENDYLADFCHCVNTNTVQHISKRTFLFGFYADS